MLVRKFLNGKDYGYEQHYKIVLLQAFRFYNPVAPSTTLRTGGIEE
jgi:hypothetical protein